MRVGCYTLDLYCDVEDCVQSSRFEKVRDQYTGKNETSCWKSAKADGWRSIAGKEICPECRKSGKKTPAGELEIP